jgi:hypothetical protein
METFNCLYVGQFEVERKFHFDRFSIIKQSLDVKILSEACVAIDDFMKIVEIFFYCVDLRTKAILGFWGRMGSLLFTGVFRCRRGNLDDRTGGERAVVWCWS